MESGDNSEEMNHSAAAVDTTTRLHEEEMGLKFLNAAETGDDKTLEELLGEYGDNLLNFKDSDGYTALHRAAYSESTCCLSLLLNRGANINAQTNDGWTPLHSASRWNAFNAVKILLKNGADVNSQTNGGQTPLHIAAELGKGRETLTILLLHPSTDTTIVNHAGDTAHAIAQRSGALSYLFDLAKPSINKI